jgi:hypothetical protein
LARGDAGKMSLKGRVAVVTGASRGVGKGVALWGWEKRVRRFMSRAAVWDHWMTRVAR